MPMFENFPYTNYHDLNLDWIIKKVMEAYSPDNPPEFAVVSVNGETGAVILYKEAVVQLPQVDEGTWNIFRKANGSDEGIQFIKGQPMQRINGTNRYNVYDQGNPPPYPVSSVDGQTGAVNTWGNTGSSAVTVPHEAEGDSWTLRREVPSGYLGIEFDVDDNEDPSGFFILKPEGAQLQKIKILTTSDIPSEAGVVSINGEAGVVVLYAGDIKLASDDNTTVKGALEAIGALTASVYNPASSYVAGDFCTYLGILYVCTGSTTGTWDPSNWTATSTGAQIKAIKTAQATDENNISTLQGQMTTANGKIETLENAMPTKAKEAIVAYRETGETASTNYSVGEYLVISGNLYRVKANISSGDQFTSSNTEAVDNIGHELTALNSKIATLETVSDIPVTLHSDIQSDGLQVRKCGKVVSIVGGLVSKTSSAVTIDRLTAVISGLPTVTNDTIFLVTSYNAGTYTNYRAHIYNNTLSGFWNSIVVPGTGSALYINITYLSNS